MPAMPRRRTILITGASAGLGAALARKLGTRGHRLALTARRSERLETVASEVRAVGGEALTIADDLADPEAPGRIVQSVAEQFGELDVLINNAGIGLPRYFSESDPDAIRTQIAINFTAPLVLTRLSLPLLIASRGTVINIGSGITLVANPILGAYGATKAALSNWNDALRRELHDRGVKVCLVALGPVATEFFDAVRRTSESAPDARRPLGINPTPDHLYNAMRDRPPRLMETSVEVAARRIARLVDRPVRRLSILRRVIWPVRLAGAFFEIFPALGDLAIVGMIRRVEREEAKMPQSPRSH
jgi:uncharacterized protein